LTNSSSPQLAQREESTEAPFGKSWLLLLFICVIGAIVRFHMLGVKSLWLDEASSVTFARLPLRDFLRTMWYGEANMSFYYFLLRAWLRFGDSEFWLRSLSVLFGLASMIAVYRFGNRFLSRRTGIAAATLLAVHCFHIRYSQELRSYSLLAFLLIVSMYLFLGALESPDRKILWMLYAIVSALAIYSQVFAVFVLAGEWLVVLTPSRIKRIGILRLLGAAAAIGVLIFPIAAVMLLRNSGQLDWVPRPSIAGTLGVLLNIAGIQPEDSQISPAGVFVLAIIFVLLAIALGYTFFARETDSDAPNERLPVLFLVTCFFFPLLAMLLFSFKKPIFIPRYLSMCVPAFILLLAHAVITLERVFSHRRIVSAIAFLFLLVAAMVGTRTYFYNFQTYGHDWRGVTSYILSEQQPGDAAIFYSFSGHRVFDYYVGRQHESGGIAAAPAVLFPLQLDRASIQSRSEPYRRVWLVLDQSVSTGQAANNAELIRSALGQHFHQAAEENFPGMGMIHVALFVSAPTDIPFQK
jgi:mannosyltransferase